MQNRGVVYTTLVDKNYCGVNENYLGQFEELARDKESL